MDGRTSVWLSTFVLALSCAGCIPQQFQKQATNPPAANTPTNVAARDDPPPQPVKAKKDGPLRNPRPETELKFGQLLESQADGELAKNNPEAQSDARDRARQAYQKALKLDPNLIEAQRSLARLYAKMGDYERSFDCYKKAMAKQPNNAPLWFELGQCHNRRKDFNESVACFKKAVQIDPENRDYLKTLGFTLAWKGDIDQGLAYLTRAQGSAVAHYNIAELLLQREQIERAKQHLRVAVRENPNLLRASELLKSLEPTSTASVK